jgi:hypothetical protein
MNIGPHFKTKYVNILTQVCFAGVPRATHRKTGVPLPTAAAQPIQCVPGGRGHGVKLSACFHFMTMLKWLELYLHSPIHQQGMVLEHQGQLHIYWI